MNMQGGVVGVIKKVIHGRVYCRRVMKQLCSLILVGIAFAAGKASAAGEVLYSDLINSYKNCSYKDNGNGTATFQVDVSYKDASGHLAGYGFNSRGIGLYFYNANGRVRSGLGTLKEVSLAGTVAFNVPGGSNFTLYAGVKQYPWTLQSPFDATASWTVDKAAIAQWPAMGVRAANSAGIVTVIESRGFAYISQDTKNGNCKVLPFADQLPPPMDINLIMTVPDWDLGELSRGTDTVKTLSNSSDQLCFTSEGAQYVTGQKYIINASNINGLSGSGRYLLKNLEDSSQSVPYNLTLQSNTDTVLLPNVTNTVLSLSKSGRTCFTPTFKALVEKSVRGGAYSDVLTFTVVAKP